MTRRRFLVVHEEPNHPLGPMNPADLPRPTAMRRVWLPGTRYDGETMEQMAAREKRYREEDALIAAEMERLWKWKCTPVWELT